MKSIKLILLFCLVTLVTSHPSPPESDSSTLQSLDNDTKDDSLQNTNNSKTDPGPSSESTITEIDSLPSGDSSGYPVTSYGNELDNSGYGPQVKYGVPNTGIAQHLDLFNQIIRSLLSIPGFKLSLVQPLIQGFANAVSQATQTAAGVTADVSKHVSAIAEVKGDVLKQLIRTFGQVAGSFLFLMSQLISSAGWAKHSLTSNIVGHAGDGVASTVGTLAQGLTDTAQIISNGVVDAVKTKKGLVHELKSGVVQGVSNIGAQAHAHALPHNSNYGR